MSTDTVPQRDPVAEFVGKWSSLWWWKAVLEGCTGIENFICRVRGHPDGPIWHNPGGCEPNMHCINCGEYIG